AGAGAGAGSGGGPSADAGAAGLREGEAPTGSSGGCVVASGRSGRSGRSGGGRLAGALVALGIAMRRGGRRRAVVRRLERSDRGD
ncbi:MAG TPA: hypothetical protein VKU41_02235, partial [Polyangiaceae bacterium]|nr:hypothetical protein [Polyangiaceae bacterium]